MGQINIPLVIDDSHVKAAAGISATKLQQQYTKGYSQPNTTATTETRTIHIVNGATATLVAFRAGSIAINAGAATITVDLKKNGTTVLSAVITLDSGNSNRVAENGTISVAGAVAGDWYEIVITATAGGGTIGTGFFCELVWREDPA